MLIVVGDHLCELTQAGGQDNHKTTAEMQEINLFHYLTKWRILKQHLGRNTQVGTQHRQTQSFLVGGGAAVRTHLSRTYTHVVCHYAVISSVLFMISEL